jgi:hypothetical protein
MGTTHALAQTVPSYPSPSSSSPSSPSSTSPSPSPSPSSSSSSRAPLAAGAPLRTSVEATVDRAHAVVALRGRIDVPASAIVRSQDAERREVHELPLWLYADRARGIPPSLTDLTLERLFPGGLSRGGYVELTTRIAGCDARTWPAEPLADPVRGRLLHVSICDSAARNADGAVALEFTGALALPRRYGTLGITGDAVVLGDPWYPIVMGPDGVPLRGDHAIDLTWTGGVAVTAEGVMRGGHARFEEARASHAPVAIVDGAAVREEVFDGVHITLVTSSPEAARDPDAPPTPEGFVLRDPWESDPTGATLDVTREAIALLRRLGFVAFDRDDARRMASRLVLVEVPERQRLAVTLPGVLAVSDRAFRILPFERVQRFHALAIARRVFAALLAPRVERTEPLADRAWVADLDGAALVDLMLGLEDASRDRPKDLIGFAGFHPAVDQLLYAPKVAFRGAYFHDVEERDPDRDGADRAFDALPHGLLVLEKLRDRMGPDVSRALESHLLRGVPLRVAAQRATSRDLSAFFRTWIGPLPKLAYRVASHSSEPSSGGYRHRVSVERLGAAWVEEPVVVELVDANGASARRVWDAAGPRGTVEWSSSARLVDATIDPDGRLIQDASLAPDHPRFDDEILHAFRPPILSSLALSLALAEGRPDAAVDVILKRRYDVRQWFGVSAAATARGISGRVRYARGVGPLRDLNSTFGSITGGVSALRSTTGFGGSRVPVSEADASLLFSWNTRIDPYNPHHGWGAGVSVAGGAAREDDVVRADGTRASGALHPSASLSVRAEGVRALHPRHILAGAIGGGATVCPALAQQLQALSGRTLLRGYAADELLGCATAYAIGEYRLLVVSGLDWNAAQLAWFKGLELVPFAAAGALSSRDDLLFRRLYAEVGGGVRGFFDWGGVQPGLVAIDLGVPLSRESAVETDADGLLRRRAPYGLYLSFEQAL